MGKYITIVRTSLQDYFVYRLNFLLWRTRAVMQLLILYFLWLTAYSGLNSVFGYSKAEMLTYILGVSLIRSYILAARLSEGVGAQIITGDISNMLTKPISYLRYIFARDLSDKLINIFFSSIELVIIVNLLKPPLVIQTNLIYLLGFAVAILVGLTLYFVVNFALSLSAFWLHGDDWWAPRFIFGIVLDFLAGGIFPIDVLPGLIKQIVLLTPFPYLLFFPMKVYLGQLDPSLIVRGLAIGTIWLTAIYIFQKWLWRRGLMAYVAAGR
jgi:ABC-2 type transport system permease protein